MFSAEIFTQHNSPEISMKTKQKKKKERLECRLLQILLGLPHEVGYALFHIVLND